jgi:hypothetical protein
VAVKQDHHKYLFLHVSPSAASPSVLQ